MVGLQVDGIVVDNVTLKSHVGRKGSLGAVDGTCMRLARLALNVPLV
jgi:hypothetical protein